MNQDINNPQAITADLLRLQKIYAAVLALNKLIFNTQSLSELFQGICKITVELGGMKMAWVGTEDALEQRIMPIACYGEGTDYLNGIFISTRADIPEGQGPTGTAFRLNQVIVNEDFQHNSMTKPWQFRAKPYDWVASATFPIRQANKVYAVLSVYSEKTAIFDDTIIALLKDMTDDISLAIDTLDIKFKQQETEKQLKRFEQIYKTLFETMQQGVIYQDSQGNIITANPAAEKILGLSLKKMQSFSTKDLRWKAINVDGIAFSNETHPVTIAIKTGQPVYDVVMGIKNRKLKHLVWLSINTIPIFKTDSDKFDYLYTIFTDITAQKQWEATLKESEERFRNFANAAPVLIWVSNENKACTWFNHTWLDYTGCSLEHELGDGWTENIHPNDIENCLDVYNSSFDSRSSFNIEYRLRGGDGHYRWFINVGKPRYDEQGRFCGYIGMLTNINARKKLEQHIRFRQFSLNHLGEEVFWISQDAQILDANQSACDTLGYSSEEIKQLHVFDIDATFPAEKWADHWQELKQHQTLRFESFHKTRTGDTFPVEIVANFFEFDGVEYNCALVRNISERKAFEQALKEKTNYLNTILNSEPECVKVVNQQGELLEMNRAGLELLEADSIEDVRQCGLMSFVLPEFKPLFEKLHHDVFQGQSCSLEFILKSKQGKQHWVDTHAAPLYDENGNVKALVAVTRDITDRVQLLQELENQARTDFLTGLPNRRYFLELAERELLRTKRYNSSLSVLMMDIDYFKSINDAYGHKTGDLALQTLAEVCNTILRTNDVIGRMGGEEFAI
ncbi:partial Diguanylate cyclase DgcM, partial [Patescibacteria group bacterium]